MMSILDDEGDGQTLKDGTVLANASNNLSTFMPLYSEALRPYRVTKVSTGFQHTLVCTDQGVCVSFAEGNMVNSAIPITRMLHHQKSLSL